MSKVNISDIFRLFSSAPKVSAYPKTVIVETTNACNLRCKMCHVWGQGAAKKREVGFISKELWGKAFHELSHWDETVNLALHGAGEPVLHKDFPAILASAAAIKNLSVGFLSNGSLWTEELTRAILDTGVSWIGFSVDGTDPEKYRKYRGTDLKKVEAAIEYLVSSRRGEKPSVFLNMVALPDLDPQSFLDRWIGIVDEVKISKYRPVGHRDFLTQKIKRIPCYLLDEMLVLTWDGKAVLCCEDIWADNVVGVFPSQSLLEIWNSRVFNRIRRLHAKGRENEISICTDCDSWSNSFTREEVDETRNLRIIKSAAQSCYLKIKK